MKLTQLDSIKACEKSIPIVIDDADGNETDIRVHIVGVDSTTYRTANAILQAKQEPLTKRIEQLTKRVETESGDGPLADNLARLLKERETLYCQMMAKCTTGFENVEIPPELEAEFGEFAMDSGINADGEEARFLRFSQAAALRLYERIPLIKGKVFVSMFERSKFLGNAARLSSNSSMAKPG